MTVAEVRTDYFRWLCQLVSDDYCYKGRSYLKLLERLDETDFTFSIPRDGNRAEDGIDLRYRFGYERQLGQPSVTSILDIRPCSVLEMLAALASRCEEHIMGDPDLGDRTGQWFWGFIENMGLLSMDDHNYDQDYTDRVVKRFLDRTYSPDGEGGLVTVPDSEYDMRGVELWYQLCWYLDTLAS